MMRVIQLALAVGGMVLVLGHGLVRSPGWGEQSNLHPVQWLFHPIPFVLGMLFLALALGLIWFNDSE